jgi:transcriptional regulator with XRE-family HTH domain
MISNYPPERLRSLRHRARLTQMMVVELTGIAINTLNNWETGKTRPQVRTLEKALSLYAIRIKRNEEMEKVWGLGGVKNGK